MSRYKELIGMTNKQSDRLETLARIDELHNAYAALAGNGSDLCTISADDVRGAMIMLERLCKYIEERKKALRL